MSRPIAKRSALLLAAAAALIVAAFAAVPAAQASTLYACVTSSGGSHIYTKKPKKCKSKKEKLVSWNTAGPAGKNGTNGTNGANGGNGGNGAAGQPQNVIKFSASQGGEFEPKPITLFAADGVTYTWQCQNVLVLNVGELSVSGNAAQAYSLGVFGRPEGQESKTSDPKSENKVVTVGKTAKTLMLTPTLSKNEANQIEDYGVFSGTVEGPTSTTWLHVWEDAGSTCTVHGTAITIPN
jgi:hypothetical protein